MSFNTLIDWNSCSPEQQRALTAVALNSSVACAADASGDFRL
ncbi:hypothetical protein LTSEWAN_3444 [Salmonella enterica subsp. enterica serovar Wandsworth str. A4-580]|uniref:Histidinol dehydrogenase n=1 Tax=Salmonella enterica subsp. enterica serovar Wandsworth str. A4-580 TaxID=913086 RepID=G5SDP9_SALET|nr:hypothetical protein LTSEWAN_3444 [Salmonella enterica subsp. enterica serovar Wandsworth str. A4-580]